MKPFFRLNEKPPAIIVNGVTGFLLLLCLLAVFFYFLGTVREFSDETQFLLLRLTAISGVLLLISAFYGFFLNLVIFIAKKKIRYLAGFILLILAAIFGGVMAAGAYVIIFLITGNIN